MTTDLVSKVQHTRTPTPASLQTCYINYDSQGDDTANRDTYLSELSGSGIYISPLFGLQQTPVTLDTNARVATLATQLSDVPLHVVERVSNVVAKVARIGPLHVPGLNVLQQAHLTLGGVRFAVPAPKAAAWTPHHSLEQLIHGVVISSSIGGACEVFYTFRQEFS